MNFKHYLQLISVNILSKNKIARIYELVLKMETDLQMFIFPNNQRATRSTLMKVQEVLAVQLT